MFTSIWPHLLVALILSRILGETITGFAGMVEMRPRKNIVIF